MAELDVYRDWLGIKEPERPLNYYQLLRLKKFEDDPVRIGTHYRKMNAHVRKYAAGDFAKESQDLLNELAKAMLCLTDARRKAEYDASLGREVTAPGRRRSFEELLLLRKVIDQEQLQKARNFANAVGLDVRDAVIQQKLARTDVVFQIYAESLGLPYIDLSDIGCDAELLPQVPAMLARKHSCVPVMVDDGQLLMASPHPLSHEVEDQLRLRLGKPVRSLICTPAGVNAVIAQHYPKEAAAAEMAAAASSATGQKAAGTSTADGAAETDPAAAAELKKQRRMITLMSFNFTLMAVVFWQTFLKGLFMTAPPTPFMTTIATGLVAGAAVAGTVYAALVLRGK